MRFLAYLVLFALIAFGIWPYYTVFRLDDALGKEDTAELATMIDLAAIRANYRSRIEAGTDAVLPPGDPNSVVGWLRQNIDRLGSSALDQAITVPWARDTLREAVTRATKQSPPYLLAAIDFAFFESFDRFLIRIGELGKGATHVRLTRSGTEWKVTDIIQ